MDIAEVPSTPGGVESPRLPAWEGPFKLWFKIVSANVKPHKARPV